MHAGKNTAWSATAPAGTAVSTWLIKMLMSHPHMLLPFLLFWLE
jgi:hypothetical protein